MKHRDFEGIVKEQFEECNEILIERGRSYATEGDFLANFKSTAKLLTELGFAFHGEPMTPESVALMFAQVKLQRWSNRLLRGHDPSDDWTDMINYVLLGEGLHVEKETPEWDDDRLDLSMLGDYNNVSPGFQLLYSNVPHRKCGNCGMFYKDGKEINGDTTSSIWTCQYCINVEGEEKIAFGYDKR